MALDLTPAQVKALVDGITAAADKVEKVARDTIKEADNFKRAYAANSQAALKNTRAQIKASQGVIEQINGLRQDIAKTRDDGQKEVKKLAGEITDLDESINKMIGDAAAGVEKVSEALRLEDDKILGGLSKVGKDIDAIGDRLSTAAENIARKFSQSGQKFSDQLVEDFSFIKQTWKTTVGYTSDLQRFFASAKYGGDESVRMSQAILRGGQYYDEMIVKSNEAARGAMSITRAVAEMGMNTEAAIKNFTTLSQQGVTNSVEALAMSQDAYSFAVAMGDRASSLQYAEAFGQARRELGMSQDQLRTMSIETSKVRQQFGFSADIIRQIQDEAKDVLSTIRNISGSIQGGVMAGLTRMLAAAKSLAVEDFFKNMIKGASSFHNLTEASTETAYMQYRAMTALQFAGGATTRMYEEMGGVVGALAGNLMKSVDGQRLMAKGQAEQLKLIYDMTTGMDELSAQILVQAQTGMEGVDELRRAIEAAEISAMSASDRLSKMDALMSEARKGGMDGFQIKIAAQKMGFEDVFDMDGLERARKELEKSASDELDQRAISLAEQVRKFQMEDPTLTVSDAFQKATDKLGMADSAVSELGITADNLMSIASDALDDQKKELAKRRTDTEKNIADAMEKGAARGEALIVGKLATIQGTLTKMLPLISAGMTALVAMQGIQGAIALGGQSFQAIKNAGSFMQGGLGGIADQLEGMGFSRVAGVARGAGTKVGNLSGTVSGVLAGGGAGGAARGGLTAIGRSLGAVAKAAGPIALLVGGVAALTAGVISMNKAAIIFQKNADEVTLGMQGAAMAAGTLTGVINFITFGLLGEYFGPTGRATVWLANLFDKINNIVPVFTSLGLMLELVKGMLYAVISPFILVGRLFSRIGTELERIMRPVSKLFQRTKKDAGIVVNLVKWMSDGINRQVNFIMAMLSPLFKALEGAAERFEYVYHTIDLTMKAIKYGIEIGIDRIKKTVNFEKISAAWERLKNALGAIFKPLGKTTDYVGKIEGQLPFLTKLMLTVADIVGWLATPIGWVVDAITWAIDNAIEPLVKMVTKGVDAIGEMWEAWSKTIKVIAIIGTALVALTNPVGWIIAAVGGLFVMLKKFPAFFEGFTKPFGLLTDMLKDAVGPLGEILGELWGELMGVFDELGDMFGALGGTVKEILKPFTGLYDALFKGSGAASMFSDGVMAFVGEVIGSGIVMVLTGAVKVLVLILTNAVATIKHVVRMVSGAISVITAVIEQIGNAIKLVWDVVGAIGGFFGALSTGRVSDAFNLLFDELSKALGTYAKNSIDALAKLFDGVFEIVTSPFKLTFDQFRAWTDVTNLRALIYDPLVKVFQDLVDKVKNMFGFGGSAEINESKFDEKILADMKAKQANIGPTSTFGVLLESLPGFAEGGIVPGGRGKDKVLARLTPGERVLSPDQTQLFHQLMSSLGKAAAPARRAASMAAAGASPIIGAAKSLLSGKMAKTAGAGLGKIASDAAAMLGGGVTGTDNMLERLTKTLSSMRDTMLDAMISMAGDSAISHGTTTLPSAGGKFSPVIPTGPGAAPVNVTAAPGAAIQQAGATTVNVSTNELAAEQRRTNELLSRLLDIMAGSGASGRSEISSGNAKRGARATDPFGAARFGTQVGMKRTI